MSSSDNSDVWRFENVHKRSSTSAVFDAIVAELEARSWNPDDICYPLADEGVANAQSSTAAAATLLRKCLQRGDLERHLFPFRTRAGWSDSVKDPTLKKILNCRRVEDCFIRNFMTRVWHNSKGNVIYMKTPNASDDSENGRPD